MRYIFLFIILMSSLNLYSQTKVETENWIKSKFEKWKEDFKEPNIFNDRFKQLYIETPISIQFIGCEMIFKTSRRYELSSSVSKITYKINIGDIEELNWVDGFNLYISSRKTNIKSTFDNSDVRFTKGVALSINIYAEENLKERLTKAINHLKSFCTQSKDEKEVF
jgi:hypothetical protein